MDAAGVSGALIVQPINHLYDHSYVQHCLQQWPQRFKGMGLLQPESVTVQQACTQLQTLQRQGFCSVRFNPYLWPEGQGMSNDFGRQVYKKAGELKMPVGFMCFKGLRRHYSDITALLQCAPQTQAIIDHFGFFRQEGVTEDESWQQLLALAQYPQVYVKTSAFFRVSSEAYPYNDMTPKVLELLDKFGADRLMWGSDYPFVKDSISYNSARFTLQGKGISEADLKMIMGGTAQRLFGHWN
ncbi:hypothetical protein JKP88DRAFT_186750 [Tribonema minus]|uniref:Amidohydrolase-related domain-containing protein n=1 Tax=Tribonema minus TaxID=303371 RepID=A0A835YUE6_9STRA|nr:hypothetical protein JKP88DRAFT_186750 [Tribonema minus]